MRKTILGLGCWLLTLSAVLAQTTVTFVPAGSVWKYLDNGSDQGTAWRAMSFNDSAWASGPAQLGFGDGDEATLVNRGPSGGRYITTYFRRAFNVPASPSFSTLTVRLVRDDGGIVYLNGIEIFRSSMPADPVNFMTFASSRADGGAESQFFSNPFSSALLLTGTNVLAVEIHQVDSGSSNVSFDLDLTGVTTTSVTGPTVVAQPGAVSVAEGSMVQMTVTAAGTGPLDYQWQKDGAPLVNGARIGGARTPGLSITAITATDAGAYSVVVSNSGGTVTSAAAALNVQPLPMNVFDDFDPAINLSQWLAFGGTARATNFGGSVSSPNALTFGGSGDRFATTRAINTTLGGFISFSIRLAGQVGGNSNWENADLPDEGVAFEYSTDTGLNWIRIATYDKPEFTAWTLQEMFIPPGAQSARTLFRWRQLANSGSPSDHWAIDDVDIVSTLFPPIILGGPEDRTGLPGDSVTLAVNHGGTAPLRYQWLYNGSEIFGATKASLTLGNLEANSSGLYQLVIQNDHGVAVSREARVTVLDLSGDVFRIVALSTNDPAVVEHSAQSGSSRGGIAASDTRLFYSGLAGTACFDLADLGNGTSVAAAYDTIVSDLRSGKMYVIASATGPLSTSGGVATRLIEVDGATGLLTGNSTPLTAPLPISGNNFRNIGFFSGVGRIAVFNGTNAFSVFLPSGLVVDHGRIPSPAHTFPDGWAYWGVVEYFDGATWLTRVRDFRTISRTRVSDGYTETVGQFQSLGDMSAFTLSPGRDRWYFHFQNFSQFGAGAEMSGSAGAQFSFTQDTRPVSIVLQPRGQTAVAGKNVDFLVGAVGFPLNYQWYYNGTPLPGETGSRLRLNNVSPPAAGVYSATVSNQFGVVTSTDAMLRVVPQQPVYVFDDPNYVETYGGIYSESDAVQASIQSLGHLSIPFTNLAGAIAPGRVVLFPSLAYGNPAPAFGVVTQALLRNFVVNGGLVVVHGGGNSVQFVNDIYGLSVLGSFAGASLSARTAQSEGTAFADAPGEVPYNSGTYGLTTNSLPFGARSIYETNGISVVAILPVGSGRIVFLGWNWENAVPTGTQDGGWIEVLGAALQETVPPVAQPPAIAVQPQDRPTVIGIDAPLSVVAFGSAPLTFQWLRDGVPITGATNSTVRIGAPSVASSASYAVVASNPFGVVTSRTARVTVRVSRGLAGYYFDSYGTATPYTAAEVSLLQAGFTPQRIADIATFSFTPLSVLLIDATYFSAPSSALQTRMPAVTAWVMGGGRLIVHDITGYSSQAGPSSLLIGAGRTHVAQNYITSADVTPPGDTLVTAGPHGTITDDSLDSPDIISLTTIIGSTLAPGMIPVLHNEFSPTNYVAVSYGLGSGVVFYSTIYLYQLLETGLPTTPVVRTIYLPNVIEHVMAYAPSGPVLLVQPPLDTTALLGGVARLEAFASGLPPLRYQWSFNGAIIPGATNSAYLFSNATASIVGAYSVFVTNPLGATNSPAANVSVIDAKPFRIVSLGTSGSQVVDHDALTSDDRGGIAVSRDSVFITGDSATARFNAADLTGGVSLGRVHDGLLQNLRDETVFVLANGTNVIGSGGGIVDGLIRLDGLTGALTTNRLLLSAPVPMDNYGVGIYSGFDAAVLHNGTRAYRIDLVSGLVTDLGVMPMPLSQSSESWAHWGVAEYYSGSMWLVQVQNSQTITRSRVPDGLTSTVGTFTSLGDMASFTMSLSRDRWYFHYEGSAQFGGSSETLGYATATWDKPPQISLIADRTIAEDGSSGTIAFSIVDDQTVTSGLVVAAESSNTNLLPAATIVLGGSAGSRTIELTPAPNQHGTSVVTITVADGIGSVTNRSFSLVVTPVNDPPSFLAGTNVVLVEDAGPQVFPGWAASISPGPFESGQATGFIVSNSHPAIFALEPVVMPTGDLLFVPAPDAHGVATVTVILMDDGGGQDTSAPQSFTITLLPGNDPPVAHAQAVTTAEDAAVSITLTGADIDGDALAYEVVTPPAHGVLSGAGANLVFTPTADYHGPDSFTFKASDGQADSLAVVTLLILPLNDSPVADPQVLTNQEDRAFIITLGGSDADGDALTYELLSSPTNGTLTPTFPLGVAFLYQPDADFFGDDSFTFRALDGATGSAPATIVIHTEPFNDPPSFVAGPDITVAEDSGPQSFPGWATSISAGPANESTQSVRFTVFSGLVNFFAVEPSLSPDGTLTFTPAPNARGTASATVLLADNGESGSAVSPPVRLNITLSPVNDAPAAGPAELKIAEDSNLGPALLLLATDPDGDALTFSIVTPPAHGTVTPQGLPSTMVDPIPGTSRTIARFLYTPATNYHGPDSFAYTVSDGQADSAPATVSITVTPENDAPVANAQSLTTTPAAALPITLAGSDVDGDALTFSIVTPPAHGALSGSGANLVYTPATNYLGTDSFTFKVNDGLADSAPATVMLTVQRFNRAPVAKSQSVSVKEDHSVSIKLAGSDADGDALTYILVKPPAHGTLTGTDTKRTYRPGKNYEGTDSFTFKVNDGLADSAPATVSILIKSKNDEPVAVARVLTLVCVVRGACEDVIIAPDNQSALVVLDGSQSYDPDGDALQFFWTLKGGPSPLGTLAMATNLFSTGKHEVQLLVDDGDKDDKHSVEFEVITPAEALEAVKDLLHGHKLPKKPKPSLEDLIKDAMRDFDRDRFTAGVEKLRTFQDRVLAEIAPGDTVLAAELTGAVQTVLEALVGR